MAAHNACLHLHYGTYVYTHTCILVHVFMHTNIHAFIHICTYTCMHVCVRAYMFEYF